MFFCFVEFISIVSDVNFFTFEDVEVLESQLKSFLS